MLNVSEIDRGHSIGSLSPQHLSPTNTRPRDVSTLRAQASHGTYPYPRISRARGGTRTSPMFSMCIIWPLHVVFALDEFSQPRCSGCDWKCHRVGQQDANSQFLM